MGPIGGGILRWWRGSAPRELRRRWRVGAEIALFDVREEGPFADAHPLFAVSLPLPAIEVALFDLVPRSGAPIALYDDGEGLAEPAAARIEELGYSEVAILEGGLRNYARFGELYRDVNVPSKAFGELVESIRHTPSLAASEVKALLEGKADVAILDSRRFEEYRTMSIPGGISVPGGELVLRVADAVPLARDAGDRPIAPGAPAASSAPRSLVNAGIANPVAVLRNGTIGWTLAGQSLDQGQTRRPPPLSQAGRDKARAAARRWARAGRRAGHRLRRDWPIGCGESDRHTLYRLDVRTPEEHAAGHTRRFPLTPPGGQLVQATDEWVAVRGARASSFMTTTAFAPAWRRPGWCKMGWQAVVVAEDALVADEVGLATRPRPALPQPGAASIYPG